MQCDLVEIVPLSQENQDWVHEEIQLALNPNRWKKTANWLRYWSLTGISITAFLALVAMVITLGIFAINRASQESEFRGSTQIRLTGIETRLIEIEKNLLEFRTSQAAAKPTDKTNIAQVEEVLKAAQRNSVRLPTDIVEQSGKTFIAAASKEPAAWDAALAFLNYRSFLNGPHSPDLQTKFVLASGQQLSLAVVVNGEGPLSFDVHWPNTLVPINEAFIYQPLSGLPQPPAGVATEPRTAGRAYLRVDNPRGPGKILLDGMHLKNIIFRDMRIFHTKVDL